MVGNRPCWARGPAASGPAELLDAGFDLDEVLRSTGSLHEALAVVTAEPLRGPYRVLAPLGGQEVWASGVTFERSRIARREESTNSDFYDRIYAAERPELFFKASAGTARGVGEPVGIRADSGWDVPEPELALVLNSGGEVVACTIGNDMSSRAIEGANPLYLPQAKVYRGSCALGPCLMPIETLPPLGQLSIHMEIHRGDTSLYAERVSVSQMRRTPDELADWLFRGLDFPIGVVLLTGTALVPDAALVAGDVVSIRIDGLGELRNQVELVDTVQRERRPA